MYCYVSSHGVNVLVGLDNTVKIVHEAKHANIISSTSLHPAINHVRNPSIVVQIGFLCGAWIYMFNMVSNSNVYETIGAFWKHLYTSGQYLRRDIIIVIRHNNHTHAVPNGINAQTHGQQLVGNSVRAEKITLHNLRLLWCCFIFVEDYSKLS
jgi:hypothetical protein